MKIGLDGANSTPGPDAAEEKFNVALQNAEGNEDQLSEMMAKGMVSFMGNIMMKLSSDVLSEGLADDE